MCEFRPEPGASWSPRLRGRSQLSHQCCREGPTAEWGLSLELHLKGAADGGEAGRNPTQGSRPQLPWQQLLPAGILSKPGNEGWLAFTQ